MKAPAHTTETQRNRNSGFALIASFSIMSVLVLIAVALFSLSSVATRSATNASAKTEAQANARMALMKAIGELQKSMGPDQRISANAAVLDTNPDSTDIVGVNEPHWLGIWDSWVAGDLVDAPVNSQYPSAPSHHQTIGDQPDDSMHPDYPEKNKHFRNWLVSLLDSDINSADPQNTPVSLALNGQRTPGYVPNTPTAVQLVGEVSLGGDLSTPTKSADYVSARLIPMIGDDPSIVNGRYGWWVGDESQKAKILANTYEDSDPDSLADKLFRQQAPASLGNSEIGGLENVASQNDLYSIPSRGSLPLINGATSELNEQFHHVTTTSLGVLADVREGGLKRDLSAILEREIDPEEVYDLTSASNFERATSLTADGEDFMLYNFDDLLNSSVGETGEAAVPIQDLAAYYQLYNRYRPNSKGGIQYSSSESSPPNSELRNGIMVSNPDYGETQSDTEKYLRQHSALYRMPVPVKIEMMLSYVTEPIVPVPSDPAADRYNLRLGVSPAVTLWNPNNVPLVMNIDDPDQQSYMMRETPMPIRITFNKLDASGGNVVDTKSVQYNEVTNTQQGELYTFFISGNYSAVFEPGESKVFALRYASGTDSNSAGNYVDFMLRGRGNRRFSETFIDELELVPGWNPDRFLRTRIDGGSRRGHQILFTFKDSDYFSASVSIGGYNTFTMDVAQKSRHGRNAPGVNWHFRSYNIRSRFDADSTYRDNIVYQGFPLTGSGISDTTPRTFDLSEKSARTLINAMGSPRSPNDDLPLPFFYYGLKAATETHESNNLAGAPAGAARRFVTRPFTHSTPMSPAFIDNYDPASFYNYGWNWFVMPLENSLDAPVEISGSNSGYYGGGYTAENGVTNIVQQQLPLTPPISIASLSHAHLGGYSLGTEAAAAGYQGLSDRNSERFSRTTVHGFGGLAPHTLQAIGNSYAHPNIRADEALRIWPRRFEQRLSAFEEPIVDHSYLANKALWDEFFFSSISPKPGESQAFRQNKTADVVAREFFFDNQALPNPRITPYRNGFDQSQLDALFTEYDLFKDGFADKIAAHLMVEGPFNINSTSVAAWKAFLSSLKGQEVSYLDADSALVVGTNLDFDRIDGVPLTGGPLPNGQAVQGSSSDPSDPEQWTGFRELTEKEIEELAIAMVKQVKLRGPFLSLSEFINRRLEDYDSATEFALNGALQAAIDDPNVSINDGFIGNSLREFSSAEKSYASGVIFDEALEGPIAYGSNAYIDQADLLKNFPSQLTPRGDTFVVRAYGDTLNPEGKVEARAWCEAVVQRIPDYVDPDSDEPYVKQSELLSDANKAFGRQFKIVSFRWLDPSEV